MSNFLHLANSPTTRRLNLCFSGGQTLNNISNARTVSSFSSCLQLPGIRLQQTTDSLQKLVQVDALQSSSRRIVSTFFMSWPHTFLTDTSPRNLPRLQPRSRTLLTSLLNTTTSIRLKKHSWILNLCHWRPEKATDSSLNVWLVTLVNTSPQPAPLLTTSGSQATVTP